MRPRLIRVGMLLMALPFVPAAQAQTASLGKRAVPPEGGPAVPYAGSNREVTQYQGNSTLERASLIAIKVKPPKTFKVNDLITIIVRQQKKFEAEGELETKKKLNLKTELEAFFKPFDGGLGATTFYRGKPNVDYRFNSKLKNEGDVAREDSFITRITARIIDVKPNGNLVLEASSGEEHDDEVSSVTLTGECRSTDVTPDNTILSTQVAELRITEHNKGAVKDASTRGWVTRLLDVLKPF